MSRVLIELRQGMRTAEARAQRVMLGKAAWRHWRQPQRALLTRPLMLLMTQLQL